LDDWSALVQSILLEHSLWGHIDDTCPYPSETMIDALAEVKSTFITAKATWIDYN